MDFYRIHSLQKEVKEIVVGDMKVKKSCHPILNEDQKIIFNLIMHHNLI